MNEGELRPCPFCGAGPDNLGFSKLMGHLCLQCEECWSAGPWVLLGSEHAERKAFEGWNKRHVPDSWFKRAQRTLGIKNDQTAEG